MGPRTYPEDAPKAPVADLLLELRALEMDCERVAWQIVGMHAMVSPSEITGLAARAVTLATRINRQQAGMTEAVRRVELLAAKRQTTQDSTSQVA